MNKAKWILLIFVIVCAQLLQAQTIKKFKTEDWFTGGHAWADSVDSFGDSIAVYKKGVLDSVRVKALKTTAAGDTIYSNQIYIDGAGADLTFDFKVNNIAGTAKCLVNLGVFTGINYKWVAMTDTIRQDTTFTYNLSAQTWGPYQVSNEYVLYFQEIGAQQTRFAWEARSFQWK